MRKNKVNIVLLIFFIIAIKANSSFVPEKYSGVNAGFIIKDDLDKEKSEFKLEDTIKKYEKEKKIDEQIKSADKIEQNIKHQNVKKEKIKKEQSSKKQSNKEIIKPEIRVETNKKELNTSEIVIKEDIIIKKNLEENIKKGFYDKRISYFNEAVTGIKYTNDSLSGKFKSDIYINNGLEFSAKKNNSEYKGFIIKRLEGEYYNSETIRDEFQIGGRFIQYYPGKGLLFLGTKYYQGESSGYYLDNGDYIDRNKLNDNKFRGEIGGYYEKNGYFINGVIGQDFAGSNNKIYEDGNFKNIELGPRIERENGDFLIPSIEYNNEDYDTYKFDEVWLKMAYEKRHAKGYIIPYVSLLAFRNHKAEGENGDFDTKFPDRYRIGVRGLQKLDESWDLTYGAYWQNESRDYKSGTGRWDSIFTYMNITYKFDNLKKGF